MQHKLSIQYISDIHLEFYKSDETFNIIPHSPNLALCGDIGYPHEINYMNFINQCSKKFKNVFVIFGNHEYYNKSNVSSTIPLNIFIDTMADRKKYTNFPNNVYFLDNDIVYLDIITNTVYKSKPFDLKYKKLVKIIGSTLWSNIDYETSLKMNDVKMIYTNTNKLLTHIDIKNMFITNINWILYQIRIEPDVKCILLTHHAVHPIFMDPDIYSNPRKNLENAYSTQIPELYENKNLLMCICGHTHNTIKIKMQFNDNYIYFLSNQVGYKFEQNKKIDFFGRTLYNPNDPYYCEFSCNV